VKSGLVAIMILILSVMYLNWYTHYYPPQPQQRSKPNTTEKQQKDKQTIVQNNKTPRLFTLDSNPTVGPIRKR
jgi:hypothetical protein